MYTWVRQQLLQNAIHLTVILTKVGKHENEILLQKRI